MADLWQAAAFAAFLAVTWLLAGDQGHDAIKPGQAEREDGSDVYRRLP
jgi:hypothetical protein